MTGDRQRSHTIGMGSITAAAATFTAVVAVAVAIWDNVEMRKHNRLSVVPYVVLEHVRNDSGPLTRAEYVASNAGVGPAILIELQIGFPTESGGDSLATVWGAMAPLISRHGVQITRWVDVRPNTALGVQESETLLRIQGTGDESGMRVQEVLDRLRLRLRYESVYGDSKQAVLGSPASDDTINDGG